VIVPNRSPELQDIGATEEHEAVAVGMGGGLMMISIASPLKNSSFFLVK